MTTGDNWVLFAAAYDDDDAAKADFDTIKKLDDVKLLAGVVMSRDEEGEVQVEEHHTGLVGGGATAGGVIGLVVGLFAPPLLLSTAVGAGLGAGIGALLKRHEEHSYEIDLEEYLPPNSSAIVVVLEDQYLDRIDKAVARSVKKVNKALDSGDVDRLAKELADAGERIERAAN